jgi:protein-tyrosine phosphatase
MKVLFVCTGNAFRSPVAEAILKKLKPNIGVDSAGTNPPLLPISEAAKKFLGKENAEQFLKEYPEVLESKKLDEYDIIVAMEPRHKIVLLRKCPECEDRIVVWNISDPYFAPNEHTEEMFEQIRQKVKELADSL